MCSIVHGASREQEEPFGERLRNARRARGLSIEALAYASRDLAPPGLTYSYVGMLERGLRRPSLEAIELLARALDLDPLEFPEYRLAKFRGLFDEKAIGLDEAVANLEEVLNLEGALRAGVGRTSQRAGGASRRDQKRIA